MHRISTGRKITAGRRDGCVLWAGCRYQIDLRANRVPGAVVPNQFQKDPMVPRYRFIVKNVNRPVIGGYNCVESAIVIQVAYRQATRNPSLTEDAARLRGNIHKPAPRIAG